MRGNVKNLVWRNNVAYMRVDVPLALRGKGPFGKKKQLMKSLGTRDPREAGKRLHAELAIFHAACERVRAEQSPAFQQAKAQAVMVARPFPGEALQAAHMMLSGTPEGIAAQATERLDALDEDLSSGMFGGATFSVVDNDGTHREVQLPPHIGLELLDNARDLVKRDRASLAALNGDPSSSAQQDDQNPSMRSLFDRWKLERKPSVSTANNYETSLRAFERMHGELRIKDLTPAHVRQFKDDLVSAGGKAATINKHLTALRAITRYARANDFIASDPAAVIKLVAVIKGEKRQSFTPTELRQLFDGVSTGSPQWWIMRVALFSGMRQDEICQLTREDVAQTDGVWFFDVNDKHDKRVKNVQSARRVPIHQRLLREGLISFLPATSDRVFSNFRDTPGKKAAQRASAWFTRYRRSIGVAERYKDFHSFRHTFISAARIVMAEEDYVQITGHKSDERVNRTYGSYSLAKLKQEIDKVDWAI